MLGGRDRQEDDGVDEEADEAYEKEERFELRDPAREVDHDATADDDEDCIDEPSLPLRRNVVWVLESCQVDTERGAE